jgi:hypothetical protein
MLLANRRVSKTDQLPILTRHDSAAISPATVITSRLIRSRLFVRVKALSPDPLMRTSKRFVNRYTYQDKTASRMMFSTISRSAAQGRRTDES